MKRRLRQADYIIDIGPYAGVHGGEVVATGTVEDIISVPESITGQYLIGQKRDFNPQTAVVNRTVIGSP